MPVLYPLGDVFHYHAHIYYDDSSRELALQMRTLIAERFPVDMGRLFEQPVGPHSLAQYEVGFLPELFGTLVPWLMLNRQGLSVMVHPNTDRERDDHSAGVLWLGQPCELYLDALAISLQARGEAEPRPVRINTTPVLMP